MQIKITLCGYLSPLEEFQWYHSVPDYISWIGKWQRGTLTEWPCIPSPTPWTTPTSSRSSRQPSTTYYHLMRSPLTLWSENLEDFTGIRSEYHISWDYKTQLIYDLSHYRHHRNLGFICILNFDIVIQSLHCSKFRWAFLE